jgi:hypothetical protein
MVPSMPMCMAVTSPVDTVAAEPVQGLDDDHVEPARRGVHLHLLERRAQSARAAQRAVRVDPYDLPALELGVPPADLGLVLNRAVRSLGSEVYGAVAVTEHIDV